MIGGIAGAGNWLLDRIKDIDRWPAEGELCNICRQTFNAGGCCNLLFDLAALKAGLELYGIGVIGDDESGRRLLDETRRAGIDAAGLRTDPAEPTSFTDVMSIAGKRTFFHHRGANARFGMREIEAFDRPVAVFYLAYLLLLDGMDAPDPEFGTVAARALARMRERGALTVVDAVSDSPEKFRRIVPPALPHTDVLVFNEIEAGNTVGAVCRRPDGSLDAAEVKAAARRLMELGVRTLTVIHFPEGGYALGRDGNEAFAPSYPVPAAEIRGSVGAGDAFCAGVVYALYRGLPPETALRYGAAEAHFNLRHPTSTGGAPDLRTLETFLSTARPGPVPAGF